MEAERILLSPYPITVKSPFFGVVYGSPCSGKTEFLLRIAGGASKSVLYLGEFEPTVGTRVARLAPKIGAKLGAEVADLESLETAIGNENPQILIIDSVPTGLHPTEVAAFCRERGISLLASLGTTKEGQPLARGAVRNAILYAADLVVRIEHMTWAVEKNRFGGQPSGQIVSITHVKTVVKCIFCLSEAGMTFGVDRTGNDIGRCSNCGTVVFFRMPGFIDRLRPPVGPTAGGPPQGNL